MGDNPRIVRIEFGVITARRPRNAGSNARLGDHGIEIRVPLVRLTTDSGVSGFGRCPTTPEQAQRLLGQELSALFSPQTGVLDAWLPFEFPLWDLIGQARGLPVYALLAAINGHTPPEPFTVPCYNTSLYFDDLHLTSTVEAAELLASFAREGYAVGHRAFKIKVGRGARHMPLEEGCARDIAIVRAIREAVGPGLPLMLDANNGYNLNLTKRVLAETADCGIFWMEEAFHEDAVLYRDLKAWMQAQGLSVLIAEGEGQASPTLMDWARDGIVDVIQYDVLHPGLTRWLSLGRQLDAWGVRSAPHHYGSHFGNYASCHLAAAIQGFTFAEWDEAATPGLDTSAYAIHEGRVSVPNAPGFGLTLDADRFRHAVANGGFVLEAD
ncbi:MAG TPA: enolase C-terminal domain-like protein [Chthonomonadaceae bacterium]|nr:enolase C-terminal domain-like protein [Chthonomonadaceae bacterium]